MKIRHHKDGNKHNNDPDNIEVLGSQREHLSRHKDLEIDWEGAIRKIQERDNKMSERVLSLALDTLFTPPQKYILLRKAYGLKLEKTEREVFSRVIVKRLRALANPTLHNIAQVMLLES